METSVPISSWASATMTVRVESLRYPQYLYISTVTLPLTVPLSCRSARHLVHHDEAINHRDAVSTQLASGNETG